MKIMKMFIIAVLMFASTTTLALTIPKAQFTTNVVSREPIDNIDRLSNDFKTVFYFTDIRDCVGCKVEHQWWHKGKMVSSVKGKAKYARYRWWSKKTLTDNMFGDWTVKVYVNGKLVKTDTISYYIASEFQRQQAPVQQRLQLKEMDECEMQLRYFSEKVEENPDEPYFKFMLKKWGSRCLPE
jgi:hypothetical protein